MAFARLAAGEFTMGTPASEPEREAQEVRHRVRIERPFYLAVHEVTQREWQRVMHANPSHFARCGPDCPVENVTYEDVAQFIARLNASSPWRGFRLPSEAEWEYACRAGGGEAFGARGTLTTSEANFNGRFPYAGAPKGRSRGSTVRVGSFPPNAWGLYDMSGNVWEWTSDNYAPYPGAVAPDTPAFTPDRKVIRGGSWLFGADSARCGLRYTHRPQDRGPSLGLRLAHDAE
jgi:formylglycine-generating enzyme required for sulfatase activity